MILISHRGNINGKNKNRENSIEYISEALNLGFDVEIDVWWSNGYLYLGHDKPQHLIDLSWFEKNKNSLWVHCKNIESVVKLQNTDFHYFWHQNDDVTLTSNKFLWTYPGKELTKNSICVMPEVSPLNTLKKLPYINIGTGKDLAEYQINNTFK